MSLYVASDIETVKPSKITDTLEAITLLPGVSIIVSSYL